MTTSTTTTTIIETPPVTTTQARNSRQTKLVPPEKLAEAHAIIVGVGAVGRQVALQLAAMGCPSMTLIDPDTVEVVNLGPQGFHESDVGYSKVAATKDDCLDLNPALVFKTFQQRFRRSGMNSEYLSTHDNVKYHYVFCCVDSMEARRLIWETCGNTMEGFFDGRMSAEIIRVLAVTDDLFSLEYESTLHSDANAFEGACTAKSTIYTANLCAALMISQFVRCLRGQVVESQILLSLGDMELTVGFDKEEDEINDTQEES